MSGPSSWVQADDCVESNIARYIRVCNVAVNFETSNNDFTTVKAKVQESNTEGFMFKPELIEELVTRRVTLAISDDDGEVLASDNDAENDGKCPIGRPAMKLP